MRCSYCFYADITRRRSMPSYGCMSQETARAIVDSVCSDLQPGDRLTLAFQGGEPTLAGVSFFEDLCRYVKEEHASIHVEYALQTNGLILNEDWLPLLKNYPFLVGLSIDAGAHDENRKDAQGAGTLKRILQSKKMLEQHQIPYNVLTVLTNGLARHPRQVWSFLVKESIDFVQFIPCLDELEHGEKSKYALKPERFYQFYRDLFPLWAKSMQQGKYISVKLFDDLANLYLRGIRTACGISGECGVQFVVEGDGSVFPCDFYMLDEFYMGNLAQEPPHQLYERGVPFLTFARGYEHDEPCASCRYRSACGGGCKRMRESQYLQGQICWYQRLLDEILQPLLQIAQHFVK